MRDTTRRYTTGLAGSLFMAVAMAGCGDSGETAEAAEGEEVGGGGVITIFTDSTELFFEHPPMIAGAPGEPWAIHFTELGTFQPVTEGRLTLELQGPDGEIHTTVAEAPMSPGHYDPAPSLPAAGMYDLVMILEGPQVSDEVFVGPIRVYASEDDLPVLPPAEEVGIAFLKEQQWPIDFATVEAEERAVPPGFRAPGTLMAAPDGKVEVTAPVDGIVRWDANRSAPAEGSRVSAGQVLVRLSPVAGDDTYASLRADAVRLQRDVDRAERLVAAEAIAERRLEEARHDLEVVQARLEAMDASDEGDYVLTLRSPIPGSVVERSFAPGERVEAGATLMTIVDPRRLHLRFRVPATHADRLDDVVGATFLPEGGSEVGRTTRVYSVGAVIDPERRTLPVTFVVDNPSGALKTGMLVRGRILTGDGEPALAVPAEAVMDEDGLQVAYVQIGGETFERRAVTTGATDGQWTVITSGVRRGERVVVRGQYQIKLASLNTSEISDHGHPH